MKKQKCGACPTPLLPHSRFPTIPTAPVKPHVIPTPTPRQKVGPTPAPPSTITRQRTVPKAANFPSYRYPPLPGNPVPSTRIPIYTPRKLRPTVKWDPLVKIFGKPRIHDQIPKTHKLAPQPVPIVKPVPASKPNPPFIPPPAPNIPPSPPESRPPPPKKEVQYFEQDDQFIHPQWGETCITDGYQSLYAEDYENRVVEPPFGYSHWNEGPLGYSHWEGKGIGDSNWDETHKYDEFYEQQQRTDARRKEKYKIAEERDTWKKVTMRPEDYELYLRGYTNDEIKQLQRRQTAQHFNLDADPDEERPEVCVSYPSIPIEIYGGSRPRIPVGPPVGQFLRRFGLQPSNGNATSSQHQQQVPDEEARGPTIDQPEPGPPRSYVSDFLRRAPLVWLGEESDEGNERDWGATSGQHATTEDQGVYNNEAWRHPAMDPRLLIPLNEWLRQLPRVNEDDADTNGTQTHERNPEPATLSFNQPEQEPSPSSIDVEEGQQPTEPFVPQICTYEDLVQIFLMSLTPNEEMELCMDLLIGYDLEKSKEIKKRILNLRSYFRTKLDSCRRDKERFFLKFSTWLSTPFVYPMSQEHNSAQQTSNADLHEIPMEVEFNEEDAGATESRMRTGIPDSPTGTTERMIPRRILFVSPSGTRAGSPVDKDVEGSAQPVGISGRNPLIHVHRQAYIRIPEGYQILIAGVNQGDIANFLGAGGNQCTGIAAYAIAYSRFSSPRGWDQTTFNALLFEGDRFFRSRSPNCVPLTHEETLGLIEVHGHGRVELINVEEIDGMVDTDYSIVLIPGVLDDGLADYIRNITRLSQAVSRFIHLQYPACLITMNGYTIGLIRSNLHVYILDSHSRTPSGFMDQDGAAVTIAIAVTNIELVWNMVMRMCGLRDVGPSNSDLFIPQNFGNFTRCQFNMTIVTVQEVQLRYPPLLSPLPPVLSPAVSPIRSWISSPTISRDYGSPPRLSPLRPVQQRQIYVTPTKVQVLVEVQQEASDNQIDLEDQIEPAEPDTAEPQRRSSKRFFEETMKKPFKFQGGAFRTGARQLILNAYRFFHKARETQDVITDLSKQSAAEATCKVLGVGLSSLQGIKKQVTDHGKVFTPGKKRNRKAPVSSIVDDEMFQNIILKAIQDSYKNKFVPNFRTIFEATKDEIGFEDNQLKTFKRILKKHGFKYGTVNNRDYVMQRDDIVAHRARFLRTLLENQRRPDDQRLPVIWLDETWFDCHETTKKGIFPRDIESAHEKKKYSFSKPIGKGNETGFVTGALFTKSTKVKTDEYNFNMDFTSFKNWFQILLGCLQGSCIICFDNAPFHNQNYLPKSNAKKQELLDFLNALGHQVTEDFSKSELAEMIRPYRKGNREEVIDHMARRRGHVPLRIPPYHCHFNPIEEVWKDMKTEVRAQNSTFKAVKVIELIEKFEKDYPASKWAAHVRHAERNMAQAQIDDNITERTMEMFSIPISDDTSEDLDSDLYQDELNDSNN